jgi:hypothetical protein
MVKDQIDKTEAATETERKRRKVRAGSTSEVKLKSDYFNPYITDDSYEYRLVNDEDEYRVSTLEDNDWDKVTDGKNKVVRQACGTLKDGRTQHRILMRKRKEWYDADQKEKLAPLDEMEKELLRGQGKEGFGNNKVEADKFYIPKDSKNRVEHK